MVFESKENLTESYFNVLDMNFIDFFRSQTSIEGLVNISPQLTAFIITSLIVIIIVCRNLKKHCFGTEYTKRIIKADAVISTFSDLISGKGEKINN